MDEPGDKQWAQKYILDPLTAPEPSQETGIGSSHIHQLRHLSLSPPSGNHQKKHRKTHSYPTPPASASPTHDDFHPSNPFSNTARLDTHSEKSISPPGSPPPRAAKGSRYYPPNSAATRASSARTPELPNHHRTHHHRSFSDGTYRLSLPQNRSLIQRFPGDMSHRPLEMLRKEARAADRAPHLRKRAIPHTDTIDALDTIGGTYHHGGPYDATLASRNTNKMYSPVAAVHDSNMEAIRATPREYLQDSLQRHMPLQGTASVPSGGQDMSGTFIRYQEGADLMREPDAAGGAYKRWDGIKYHPDDLKGKGEPSFTYERDLKGKKAVRMGRENEYEMQPRSQISHHRSHSHEAPRNGGYSNSADLHRSNTTGKRISEGFRKRFGSMRRKKAAEVH